MMYIFFLNEASTLFRSCHVHQEASLNQADQLLEAPEAVRARTDRRKVKMSLSRDALKFKMIIKVLDKLTGVDTNLSDSECGISKGDSIHFCLKVFFRVVLFVPWRKDKVGTKSLNSSNNAPNHGSCKGTPYVSF